ncbi:MAG TPA: protein-methionine-sulfoxide reductase catalytic subunit MsrP [Candidatus Acidoferrum sp.]|jgi:sulfoxide reductase catalytic subunit YedY|nr:protein-methionine-sulfoxide reductase catalytic subunit MsrP [Candidatus Acidoferrum sp.]
MLIRKAPDLTYADVTPRCVYLDRRKFLQAMGIAGAAAVAGKGLFELALPSDIAFAATKLTSLVKSPYSTTEKQNSFEDVTHYNNFYEFGTDKSDPAKNSQNFKTSPWTVSVEGEVARPRKFTMDEILKVAPLEERIYRHRCVEAWSIVVPWIGFSFSNIINLVEPGPKAKFVAFESYFDPRQMPQAKYAGIDFPYVEGLRLDEAMNPLALLCVGMYGETLANQDGAPVRMILPWKYGFKSVKSIVKIRFQEKMPPTTWNRLAPNEYGFYSNVNPNVDHPRWTQSKERRLGEIFKRPTLMFNGYGDQVASLYTGMDLKKNY